MQITWQHLTFLPSPEALDALRESWSWLLPDEFSPLLASTLGDVFFQKAGTEVYWLNAGTAEVRRIAGSRQDFLDALKSDESDQWFMPSLVAALLAAGKALEPDHCYTYVTLPIFKEGKYEVANLNPVPAAEHFRFTGDIHRQIRDLPDGARVRLKVVP